MRNGAKYEKLLDKTLDEVKILKAVEDKLVFKDCVLQMFGIVSGQLPPKYCRELKIAETAHTIGIVMRYEGGGSLQNLIMRSASHKSDPSICNIYLLIILFGIRYTYSMQYQFL